MKCRNLSLLLVAVTISQLYWNAIAIAQAVSDQDRCGTDISRSAEIRSALTMRIMNTLTSQGYGGYEGLEPDARPLPKITLTDLVRKMRRSLRYAVAQGVPLETHAAYFTFHSDNVSIKGNDAISLPKHKLWCTVRRGDTVLLSHGSTHHYTKVYEVDHRLGSVDFVDYWPELSFSFMLKGHNVFGFTAELITLEGLFSDNRPRKLVRVKREEFLKVALGLVTLDSPNFVTSFLDANPSSLNRADHLLAFSESLLNADNDEFVDSAAGRLTSALGLARKSGVVELEKIIAARLHFALLLNFYVHQINGKSQESTDLRELKSLWDLYGKDALFGVLDSVESLRIGVAAAKALAPHDAVKFLSTAIEKNAGSEEAYLHRAEVRLNAGELQAALEDISSALQLIVAAREALRQRSSSRLERDIAGHEEDDMERRMLENAQVAALVIEGHSFLGLQRWQDALKIGESLISSQPARFEGYDIAGFALAGLGRIGDAKEYLQRAVQLPVDQLSLRRIEEKLRNFQ